MRPQKNTRIRIVNESIWIIWSGLKFARTSSNIDNVDAICILNSNTPLISSAVYAAQQGLKVGNISVDLFQGEGFDM